MDDLYIAARTKERGGLGITTLCRQVDKFENFRTIKTTGRLVAMGIIGAGVWVASMMLAPEVFGSFAALSIMGVAATVISKTVEGVTDSMLERRDEGRVTRQVMDICERVKTTGISPLQVLDVFVKARPDLHAQISARYGNYNDLIAYKKIDVLKDLEPTLHIAALTKAINTGTIKPNFLGLVAYGDRFDALPDQQHYQQLTAEPVPEISLTAPDSISPTQHVDRLFAQQQKLLSAAHTLH